ncbi:uncharacterized protein [Blastocystis hominis]|uniref:Zinc-finger domain-containing protein n=1 Tax=Blastocystis hominis TaxID=12968 RepID=D8LVP2_BLAHO|nr:uncharacterized protein [Blastocystis hominis]CBK19881.2 unnamed protein product [Blastocystis hominis]|eukprot:XP_012893929.1 uncharacterized protein [Blastocystis hominis]
MPTKKPTEEHLEPEEENEEQEDGGLIRTCHLCGKAQCGQRRGRVRCAYCKRVFCLQQLYKKFGIRTTVDDRNFKCPRCLGICCCVTDCKKGPPHVHCKVFKVRQNKRKNRELAALENAAQEAKSFVQPVRPIIQPAEVPPMHPAPCITRIHSIPSFTSLTALPSFQPLPTPDLSIKLEPDVPHASSYIPISPSAPSSYLPLPLPDPQPPLYADPYLSTSYGTPLELSRVQHSDWLTQLNLKALDDPEALSPYSSAFLPGETPSDESLSAGKHDKLARRARENRGFVDRLRSFFAGRSEFSRELLESQQSELLRDALQLQSKAEKSDLLLKMVDNFNQNTIHATVTWQLVSNTLRLCDFPR